MRNHAVKIFSIAQAAEMWYLAFPMKPTIVQNGIVIVFCDPTYQALRGGANGAELIDTLFPYLLDHLAF